LVVKSCEELGDWKGLDHRGIFAKVSLNGLSEQDKRNFHKQAWNHLSPMKLYGPQPAHRHYHPSQPFFYPLDTEIRLGNEDIWPTKEQSKTDKGKGHPR
jgi:hypothetical protein